MLYKLVNSTLGKLSDTCTTFYVFGLSLKWGFTYFQPPKICFQFNSKGFLLLILISYQTYLSTFVIIFYHVMKNAFDVDHCTFLGQRRRSTSTTPHCSWWTVDVHFTALFITSKLNLSLFQSSLNQMCTILFFINNTKLFNV